MIRNILLAVVVLGVAWVAWAWLGAPDPLSAQSDGLAQWQAASERQQVATAAYYVQFWKDQGADMADIAAGDMRRCIDEHIAADQGIMATAAGCAQIHLQE